MPKIFQSCVCAILMATLFGASLAFAETDLSERLESEIAERAPSLPREAIENAIAYLRRNSGRTYYERDHAGKPIAIQLRADRLVIVNYDEDNFHPRLFFIQIGSGGVRVSAQMTSHGRGAIEGYHDWDGVPHYFSNRYDSDLSPLGFMVAGTSYTGTKNLFGRPASGPGRLTMSLYGLEPENQTVGRGRDIVMHAAGYVKDARAGLSWGCITLKPDVAEKYLALQNPEIAPGTLVYSYAACDPARSTRSKCYL